MWGVLLSWEGVGGLVPELGGFIALLRGNEWCVDLSVRCILDSRTVFPIYISPYPGLFGRLTGRTAREKVIDNLLDYIPKKG